jgi:hypothetical protein
MSDPDGLPRRSRQATRLLWSERLSRFAAADLSVVAFCAAEGVSVNSFFYWKRQLAAPSPTPQTPPLFLPVRVATAAPVEIVLSNGTALRITPGCDLAFVRSLVDALAGEPC